MKIDLEDVTFLIPVRLDSIIRLENLIAVIKYIQQSFRTHLIVLEAASYNNHFIERLLNNSIDYHFIEDKDPVFYRTKYLNAMTRMSKTPFLAIWDSDVIIHKKQIMEAINILRIKQSDISYPYDGNFLDTSDIIREYFLKNNKINILIRNKSKMNSIYGATIYGGAFIVNKAKYIQAGMENETFYGWGNEDFERYERMQILEYRIFRSSGCLFHLTHPRNTFNSKFKSQKDRNRSRAILTTVKSCSKNEILNLVEVKTERRNEDTVIYKR